MPSDNLTTDNRCAITFGFLHEPPSSPRQVVHSMRSVKSKAGMVDDVDIGFLADFETSSI